MPRLSLFRRQRQPKLPPIPTRPWPPARTARTTYTVVTGWAILAELRDGTLRWQALRHATTHTTDPAVPHSVYTPPGAKISATTDDTAALPSTDPTLAPQPTQLDDLLATLVEKDTVDLRRTPN
jgi:hypothetical protein